MRLRDLSSVAKPTEIRVLPMELQLGDRIRDATGEWEVISRPYAWADRKLASAHVRKVDRPEATDLRRWGRTSGEVLERWVTPEEADADLLRLATLN